jgi:hypothetical protein
MAQIIESVTIPVNLTYALGRIKFPGQYYGQPTLELATMSGTDDGAYLPAESVSITGVEQIKILRDACDEAIKVDAERKEAQKSKQ